MKKKEIQKQLNRVHSEWCKSIKDEKVRSLVAENSIITGGCIASMLLGEEVNDYDIYFRTKETVVALCEYYSKEIKDIASKMKIAIPNMEVKESEEQVLFFISSSGLIRLNPMDKKFPKGKFHPIFATSNAITLSDKIQLIYRFIGEPEEIHSNYDFEHCKSYWCSWDHKLIIPASSAEALLARELRYTGSKYPLSSIIRTRKFIKRGWSINAGEYLKMCVQLNKLNLLDVNVLKDQLVGVDTTYFMMFISEIQAKIDSEKDFALSESYVLELIDKIFNEDSEEYSPENYESN